MIFFSIYRLSNGESASSHKGQSSYYKFLFFFSLFMKHTWKLFISNFKPHIHVDYKLNSLTHTLITNFFALYCWQCSTGLTEPMWGGGIGLFDFKMLLTQKVTMITRWYFSTFPHSCFSSYLGIVNRKKNNACLHDGHVNLQFCTKFNLTQSY